MYIHRKKERLIWKLCKDINKYNINVKEIGLRVVDKEIEIKERRMYK
jgi:hypothetical protein